MNSKFLFYRLRLCLVHRADTPIDTEQVQPADSYERIYDSGKPGHISKKECYQVKPEKSDQAPVNGSYND